MEERALAIEYRLFSSTKVITIYRRNMAQLTNEIKKDTNRFQLYSDLMAKDGLDSTLTPLAEEKSVTTGGFVKASVLAASCETVKLEAPSPDDGSREEASSKPQESRNSDCSNASNSSLTSDNFSLKKKRISRLFGNESPPVRPPTEYTPKPSLVTGSTFKATLDDMKASKLEPKESKPKRGSRSYFSSSKRSLERQTSLDHFLVPKKQRLEGSPCDPREDSPPDNDTVENTVEETKAAVVAVSSMPQNESKPQPVIMEQAEKIVDGDKDPKDVKEVNNKTHNVKTSSDKSAKSGQTGSRSIAPSSSACQKSPDKSKMAALVIECLMPHYKANQIASRDLFKSLARSLSHRILSLGTSIKGGRPCMINQ